MIAADSSLPLHVLPRTAAERSSVIATCALIAALVASIVRWSLWGESLELRPDSIIAFARLLLASLTLMLLGAATANIVLKSAKVRGLIPTSLPIPAVSQAVLFLVIGQLASMVWVFCRAGISAIAYGLTGRQLPMTQYEVGALFSALIITYLIGQKRPQLDELSLRTTWLPVGGIACALLLLVCALLPLALRELPRSIALSSDPDQHAYWAHQILRLGIIPWQQGIFGDQPFGYPAGFATLNAVWMLFSGLSAVEIVAVQPMIQCFLAMLLCGSIAPCCLRVLHRRALPACTGREVVVTCLILIALYWFVLPFGNQSNRYLGSGTARLSTSLLSSLVLLGWVLFPTKMLSPVVHRARVVVFSLATAFVATFNPMSAILPLLLTCCSAISLLFERHLRAEPLRKGRAVMQLVSLGLCIAPLLLVFCDPYFSRPLLAAASGLFLGEVGQSAGDVSSTLGSHITLPAKPIWSELSLANVARLFLAGTGKDLYSSVSGTLLLLASAVGWFLAFPAHARRFTLLIATTLTLLWLADGLHLSGPQDTPIYLVQPYIIQSLWDSGVLFGCLCIVGLITGVFSFLSRAQAHILLTAIVFMSLLPSRSGAQLNSELTLTPRVASCGSFGCVTPNDVEVFRFIKRFGDLVLAKYSNLDFANAPKILLLGHPAIHGPEKWVFPYGASRVLPQESPLPVAFFYGQGSRAWSYENYMQRVCTQFDRDWLRSHNIRYLFLPESNPGCLRGRERVLGEMTVLFESGASRFMQIVP